MTDLLLRGGSIAVRSGVARANILCRDGRIAGLVGDDVVEGATAIDCDGLLLGPGFVDIHVHGGGGISFFAGQPAEMREFALWAPRNGVTSFLASTLGREDDETVSLLERLVPVVGDTPGAEPLGFHLEGPALNPDRRGAFPRRMLQAPSPATFERFQRAANGHVRQVTLAPELPGALDLVAAITGSGSVAAMGHTDATFAEATAGFDAGITHVTHLFNAMRPFHQREGGAAAAALLDSRVTCELIADGAHVSFEMLRLAYGLLGPRRMVVVTDNMELAGTGQASASFAGGDVAVEGAAAKRPDGTIVGSVATMDMHFANVIAALGVHHATAFQLCSENPARVIGLGQRKGKLEPGFDADIVGLDANNRVALTICRGEVAFRSAAQ